MMLPREGYVLSEIFVIVRRFLQTLQAHKLNMIKREKLARHPRTTWRIWACDVTLTSRILRSQSPAEPTRPWWTRVSPPPPPPPAGVEPKSLSWQLYQFIFTGQLEVKTGLEWVGTDATSNSPIMARFWYIIDGIEIYKKRNNYANLLNCAC